MTSPCVRPRRAGRVRGDGLPLHLPSALLIRGDTPLQPSEGGADPRGRLAAAAATSPPRPSRGARPRRRASAPPPLPAAHPSGPGARSLLSSPHVRRVLARDRTCQDVLARDRTCRGVLARDKTSPGGPEASWRAIGRPARDGLPTALPTRHLVIDRTCRGVLARDRMSQGGSEASWRAIGRPTAVGRPWAAQSPRRAPWAA